MAPGCNPCNLLFRYPAWTLQGPSRFASRTVISLNEEMIGEKIDGLSACVWGSV